MASDALVGQILHDTHEVIRLIGKGGMGSVYEARHLRLKKHRLAIKVLHHDMVGNEQLFARFRREAELANELGHPNIVQVVDFYETDGGQPCIVMEYLEGEDLGELLVREGKVEPAWAMKIIAGVGAALSAVHARAVVHRDLKPANVFLARTPDGGELAKVLDFGISKILVSDDPVTQLTGDQAVLGTPHYMAPEQAEGLVHEVDHRTDIFALGILAYLILSGKLPFMGPSAVVVMRAICDKPHPSITDHAGHLSEATARVLDRALAKDKAHRYQRVDDFVEELSRALTGAEDAAGDTPDEADGPGPRPGTPGTNPRATRLDPSAADADLAGAATLEVPRAAQDSEGGDAPVDEVLPQTQEVTGGSPAGSEAGDPARAVAGGHVPTLDTTLSAAA